MTSFSTIIESKKINDRKGPCVIIASSGMCEVGRVLHHLRHALPNPDNIVAEANPELCNKSV